MLPDQSIARQNYACQLLVMKRIKTYFLLILTTLRDSKEKTTHTWSHTWIHLVTFDPSLDVYTLWVVEWSCQVVELSRLDFRNDQVQARLSTLRLKWTLTHCREPSACCLVWIFREGWRDVGCLNQCRQQILLNNVDNISSTNNSLKLPARPQSFDSDHFGHRRLRTLTDRTGPLLPAEWNSAGL